MTHGPHDPIAPVRPTANAPAWAGRPGFAVLAVTGDPDEAARLARAAAAAASAPLAPGLWPLHAPADTRAIAVGPVYVAVRVRRARVPDPLATGAGDLPTYYVLRRWTADEATAAPDPAWPVPAPLPAEGGEPTDTPAAGSARSRELPSHPTADGSARAPLEPAPGDDAERDDIRGAADAARARWPFTEVGRTRSRVGAKTLGADVITWRGPLATARGTRVVTFTTQPRHLDPHASFMVSANARIDYRAEHPHFVDVCAHYPLDADEREALAALAEAQDTRPVRVRCAGEPVRGGRRAGARPADAAPGGAPVVEGDRERTDG